MTAWFLRFHRWVALIFALPLVFVLSSAVVLSLEPLLVARAVAPHSLSPAVIESALDRHDREHKATMLAYRSYDGTLTISAGRGGGGTVVDPLTGEAQAGPSALASVLATARRIHERLSLDLGWLVVASTATMLVLAALGVLMGWPRFANSAAGWHKATAFGLLPLLVLSPLTALFMAANVTFAGPPAASAPQSPPLTLVDAVRIVGRDHDLSSLVSLRPRGGRMLARLVEDGEYTLYTVTREGTTAMPRNWPRLWHEGNFAAPWPALLNLVTSLAMVGLLGTGMWSWLRRRLRRRALRTAGFTAAGDAASLEGARQPT